MIFLPEYIEFPEDSFFLPDQGDKGKPLKKFAYIQLIFDYKENGFIDRT